MSESEDPEARLHKRGMKLAPKRATFLSGKVTHAVGGVVEHAVSGHHRRRLRKLGWEHAFDETELRYATGATFPPRKGNKVEILSLIHI